MFPTVSGVPCTVGKDEGPLGTASVLRKGRRKRTRLFIIGRPHIRAEIEKGLAGRVISMSVVPSKVDVIEYLRLKIDEDQTSDAMGESLEAHILEKMSEKISEM